MELVSDRIRAATTRARRFSERERGFGGTSLGQWAGGALMLTLGLLGVRAGAGIGPWVLLGAGGIVTGVNLLLEAAHFVAGFSGRRRIRQLEREIAALRAQEDHLIAIGRMLDQKGARPRD